MSFPHHRRQASDRFEAVPPISTAEAGQNGSDSPARRPVRRTPEPGRHGVRSRKRPRASLFQRAYGGAVFLSAVSLLTYRLTRNPAPVGALLGACVLALLLLLARAIPVSRSRERSLSFLAPLVFALSLWAGAETTAACVLLAGMAYARFAPLSSAARDYTRFQSAQLALSAFAAQALWRVAWVWIDARPEMAAPDVLWQADGVTALRLMASALLSAAGFVLANLLLTAGANLGRLRLLWNDPKSRARLFPLALVYFLGLLPTLLLAPLGGVFGIVIALPLLVMLLMSAQIARLQLDVAGLRRQLRTSEAMGHAGIAESNANLDPAPLWKQFLRLARPLVRAERGLVWTLNAETGELRPTAALPDFGVFTGQKVPLGEGLIGQTAARKRPRLSADAARDPLRGKREAASGAWLLYPIVVQERLLGLAHWIRPVSRPFTQEDVTRLGALVPQAAVALENLRIREEIHSLAATDGLTGLWNHKRTHELLSEEMRRSSRYHRALSVLMLDVDSFKAFNDAYGHPQGDQLLRRIANVLQNNVRTVDHLGRYGGEEFLVVLPETTKDDACRLAERIRSEVEIHAMVTIEEAAVHRTVSVGVASYPEDALNPAELVQRADEALYRAKRAGKNCVIWA